MPPRELPAVLEAICPNGHRLQVPHEHAGLKLRCPACNAVFQLVGPPASAGAATAIPPPSAAAANGTSPSEATAATTNPATAAAASPAGAVSPVVPPTADAPGSRWSGTEPLTTASVGNAAPPASPSNAASSSKVMPSSALPTPRTDWQAQVHLWIKPVLVLGLVMAISARGCDSLAVKNVARLQGALELERRDFQAENDAAVATLDNQLKQTNITPAQKTQFQKQLDDLKAAHDKRRAELQSGEWRELTEASERAVIEVRAGAYGHELLFLAGTILFAVGLLTTSLLGEGSERWLCFSLLAIVVFSLYVGGAGWSAAILSGVGR